MTNRFIDNRVQELERTQLSLSLELNDPMSNNYPGTYLQRAMVEVAVKMIGLAADALRVAKTQ